jgi:hypothetical protein
MEDPRIDFHIASSVEISMPLINVWVGNDLRHASNKGEFTFEEMPRVGELVRFSDGDHPVLQVVHVAAGASTTAGSAILIPPHPL